MNSSHRPVAEPGDLDLLHAWHAGDPAAGALLFRRHYDAVARFFRYKVGAEAGDLIQQTFLLCVECSARFAGRSSFRAFLLGIARNVLLKHIVRKRPQIDPGVSSLHELGPSLTSELAQREDQQRLLLSLRRLPIDAQVLLELYFWEGLGGHELAEMYGLPEATLRSRIRRARQQLARVFDEEAGASPDAAADLDAWAAEVRGRGLP